jgi:LuxR family maltose regulon positive regulatory protein
MRADLVVTVPVSDSDLARCNDPLLESKFEIPERPRFMVTRPRLFERLSRRSEIPVTLVVGPAGSGKTQLVASWAAIQPSNIAVVWVTLEDDDDQSCIFWTYVIEALRRGGVLTSPAVEPPSPNAAIDRSFLVRSPPRCPTARHRWYSSWTASPP